MPFIDIEKSISDGKPFRLYRFSCGALWREHFTDADTDITINNKIYQPIAISDDGIKLTGEASADTLEITLPSDNDLLLFLQQPLSAEVSIAIEDGHHGETDTAVVFMGSVSGMKLQDGSVAKISCQSLAASMKSAGLRLFWGRAWIHCFNINNSLRVDCFLYRLFTDRWLERLFKIFSVGCREGAESHGNEQFDKVSVFVYGG